MDGFMSLHLLEVLRAYLHSCESKETSMSVSTNESDSFKGFVVGIVFFRLGSSGGEIDGLASIELKLWYNSR